MHSTQNLRSAFKERETTLSNSFVILLLLAQCIKNATCPFSVTISIIQEKQTGKYTESFLEDSVSEDFETVISVLLS